MIQSINHGHLSFQVVAKTRHYKIGWIRSSGGTECKNQMRTAPYGLTLAIPRYQNGVRGYRLSDRQRLLDTNFFMPFTGKSLLLDFFVTQPELTKSAFAARLSPFERARSGQPSPPANESEVSNRTGLEN